MGWTRKGLNVFQKEKVAKKDANFFKKYLHFSDFTSEFLYDFFSPCRVNLDGVEFFGRSQL